MKRWNLLVVLSAVLALSLLTGCVDSDSAPTSSEDPLGAVNLSAVITAADVSPQRLTEYGVFYSTSRDDIVAVNGVAYMNNLLSDEDFVVRDGVQRVSSPTDMQIAASQSGSLDESIAGLAPNTTYYYRFYTVGYDETDLLWKFAMQVGNFTTMSKDAKLKSITISKGKLSPAFRSTRTSYSTLVSAKTTKVGVTARAKVSGSRIKMKVGAGKWKTTRSVTVKPRRGKSVNVYIKATATDKVTTKSYLVKVRRKR